MNIKNIDIYNLPVWFSNIIEEADILCEEALKESVFYNMIIEERSSLLDRYGFISKLKDNDMITEPLKLTYEETKVLSRFFALEYDKARAESIQMYLLGGKHVFKLLQTLDEM